MKFTKDRWLGNKWACIDVDPYEYEHFPIFLLHFQATYKLKIPNIIDMLDAYGADFKLDGADVMMNMDNWCFSIAFSDDRVRDRVFEDLNALPPDFFELKGKK